MPRGIRFLSCSFTGLLISLLGFLMAAYWYEGGRDYWQAAIDFTATAGFWYLAGLFALLGAVALIGARLAVYLVGLADAVAGICAGAAVAFVYAFFLITSHAQAWGGLAIALQKSWAPALAFTAPFALSGGFTAWLWHRLD